MALPTFSPLQIEPKATPTPPPSSFPLSFLNPSPIPSDQFSDSEPLLLRHYQTLILSAESLLREKDAQSKQIQLQNLALQHKLRSLSLQNHRLFSIARRSEALSSALRVCLQNLTMQNEAAAREREGFGDSGEVGEEESFCAGIEMEASRFKCRVCGERDVSILLMPCNHLCICGECEGEVRECPRCLQTKRSGMRVFL